MHHNCKNAAKYFVKQVKQVKKNFKTVGCGNAVAYRVKFGFF